MHVSPRTVARLVALGHDAVRVSDVLPPSATDAEIVAEAIRDSRAILTQDLDFSALVALSGRTGPSVISLRLSSSRVETVNDRLAVVLPAIQAVVGAGAIVAVEDAVVRIRTLPLA